MCSLCVCVWPAGHMQPVYYLMKPTNVKEILSE